MADGVLCCGLVEPFRGHLIVTSPGVVKKTLKKQYFQHQSVGIPLGVSALDSHTGGEA
jgi:hypothetical protein